MSEEHTTLEVPVEDAQRSLGDPNMLNCTKVVRLFVLDPANGRTEQSIRANESPTRADVFVDRTKLTRDGSKPGGELIAKSIGRSAMVPHHQAHHEHRGSVVVLSAESGDQIEWQCDVPFRVVSITLAEDGHEIGFLTFGKPPAYPFKKDLGALREGNPSLPIRSGGLKDGKYKQLYKAHFELLIDGEWKLLDPDFYGTCGN